MSRALRTRPAGRRAQPFSKATTLASLHQMRLISCSAEFAPRTSDTSDPFNFTERRSSPGPATGKSVEQLVIPCLRAFLREAALPASVFGPVERLALARFACSFRSEIGNLVSTTCVFCGFNSPVSDSRNPHLLADALRAQSTAQLSCPWGRKDGQSDGNAVMAQVNIGSVIEKRKITSGHVRR
jgi:hypothetical protein